MMDAKEKPTGLALLRAPFPDHAISKLPKPTISNDKWRELPKGKCSECGGWHATSSTMHLDYVGHAALTDRLLDADPNWTWEPLAFGPDGLPAVDKDGGMWIKLTVCGVTRYGYGDAQGKSSGNAVKERIGDALRNAAMRFGAALDLWHKGELHPEEDEDEKKGLPASQVEGYQTAIQDSADPVKLEALWKTIVAACNKVKDVETYEKLKPLVAARGAALKNGASNEPARH
jgi:hypothetical protein